MDILTVKDANNGFLVGLASGETVSVPKAEGNRHYQMVQDYIAGGGVIAPPDPWEPTLAQARIRRIREIKLEARQIMTDNTDWYVTRKAEIGTVIPEFIQTYRSALRQVTNDAETAINALATIETVRDYKPVWPTAPVG